jgi:putative addiction module component (TIGR02574 family)
MDIDVNKLLALPAAERMKLAELLWQSLASPAETETLLLPAWQQAELNRLLDEYDSDGDDGLPAEVVMAEIRSELWPLG